MSTSLLSIIKSVSIPTILVKIHDNYTCAGKISAQELNISVVSGELWALSVGSMSDKKGLLYIDTDIKEIVHSKREISSLLG